MVLRTAVLSTDLEFLLSPFYYTYFHVFFLAMYSCYWLRLYEWECIWITMGCRCLIDTGYSIQASAKTNWLVCVKSTYSVYPHRACWGFQSYHRFPARISFLNYSRWVNLLILENITSSVSVYRNTDTHANTHKNLHTWNLLLLRSVWIIYSINIRLSMSLNK